MAKANPTLLSGKRSKKVVYYEGGESHTFVRCKKCEFKYNKDKEGEPCPSCGGSKKPVQKS